MIADGGPDNLAFSDNFNDNPDKFSSSPVKSTQGTEVPHFDLSSDTEPTHSEVIQENETVIDIKDGSGTTNEFNNKVKESNTLTSESILPSDESIDNNHVTPIFLNTQIQSRLDDADEKTALKTQLSQFKYPQEETRSLSEPLLLKRLNSITNAQSSIPKKRRKTSPKASKAINLMEMLSGKHKKVKDIIKTNKMTKSKSKTSRKVNKEVYDIYNEEEWNALKKLLLDKFPENTKEDVQDMFHYVYGEEEANTSNDITNPRVDMWSASQQQLVGSQKVSQDSFIDNHETISQRINFLSLSQVMEDTSINHGDTVDLVEEKNEKIEVEDKLIPVDSDIVINSSHSENLASNIEPTKDVVVIKEDTTVLDKNSETPELTILDEIIRDNKEYSVIYDSMDDSDEQFYIIHDKERYELKRRLGFDNHQKKEKTVIPNLNPGINLGHTPLMPFSAISPAKDETIIDLTQGSFKVNNELVSPIKSVVSDLVQKEASQKENEVQVPATRTGTFNKSSQKMENVTNTSFPDIALAIKQELIDKLNNRHNGFIIKSAFTGNPTDVVYDSYEDEEEKINNRKGWIILSQEDKSGVTSALSNINTESDASVEESIEMALKETPEDGENDIWLSQSAKDIRTNIRQLGLKTARTKSEMIESLQFASQIAKSQDVGDTPDLSPGTRKNIFNHLTQLAKQLPSVVLEKFYTFQPIPVTELTEMFVGMDPFVKRIEEQTIKEWAEQNGISLRQ